MLDAVLIACLVLAAGSFGLAILNRRRRAAPPEPSSGPLAFALAFTVLAATVAIVEERTEDPDDGDPSVTESAAAGGAPKTSGPVLEYEFDPADLGGFVGRAQVVDGRTSDPLCLVAYFDRQSRLGVSRSYKWWTTCADDARSRTLDDVHQRLALPPDWGTRTTRAVACVPAGEPLPHVRGRVAPKLSDDSGRIYRGGAVQYRVTRFDTRWIVRYDRVRPAPARLPRAGDPCD